MKRLPPLRKQKESKVSKNVVKKQKVKSDDNIDDDEWERIEQLAKKTDNNDDDNNNDDDDDDDEDDDDEDDIPLQTDSKTLTEEYTFDFNDINEIHTESITTILKSSFFGNATVAYQIAQEIVKSSIGTCIVNEAGEEVFGFASVIALDQLKSSNSSLNKLMDDIMTNISKVSKSSKVMESFESQLKDNSNEVGILIHSRFTNLPLQLITPLHKNLIDDIKWAKTDGNKSEKSLKKVLLLSTCNISDTDSTKKSDNFVADVTGSSNVIHDYFENDIFCQNSGTLQMKTSLMPNKTLAVSLIEIDKLEKCLIEINNMLD